MSQPYIVIVSGGQEGSPAGVVVKSYATYALAKEAAQTWSDAGRDAVVMPCPPSGTTTPINYAQTVVQAGDTITEIGDGSGTPKDIAYATTRTIPANVPAVGTTALLILGGTYRGVVDVAVLSIVIKIGSVAVATIAMPAFQHAAAPMQWSAIIPITFTTVGASGVISGLGLASPAPVVAVADNSLDTTADMVISLWPGWDTDDSTNTSTLKQFIVQILQG